jgi:hypothetical protein
MYFPVRKMKRAGLLVKHAKNMNVSGQIFHRKKVHFFSFLAELGLLGQRMERIKEEVVQFVFIRRRTIRRRTGTGRIRERGRVIFVGRRKEGCGQASNARIRRVKQAAHGQKRLIRTRGSTDGINNIIIIIITTRGDLRCGKNLGVRSSCCDSSGCWSREH